MKKNLLLLVSVPLFLYLSLEAGFLYWFPRVVPASALTLLDEGLQSLLQSSKRGLVPEHYIALLGDSYAQGMGDWASEAMNKPMARYHSAHLLQDKLGQDVVTFGSAGAGSVRALVTEPISQLAYLQRYTFHLLPEPDVVLVYFYEGNDLYDNADYFNYSFPHLFDSQQQWDAATYQQYLQQFALEHDATYRKAQRHDIARYFPLAGVVNILYRHLRGMPVQEDPDADLSLDPPWRFGVSTYQYPGKINRAIIKDQLVQLPDNIQASAVGMTAQEMQQAWFAFEQALIFSRQYFSHSRFVLVYIPSVLSVYDMQNEYVSVQAYTGRKLDVSLQDARQSSSAMHAQFQRIAAQQHIPVIDVTKALQSAAHHAPVHGPEDWNHLNRKGYEVLAEAIASQYQEIQHSAQ